MAKKRAKKQEPVASAGELSHNPFGSLAGISAPAAASSPTPTETSETAPAPPAPPSRFPDKLVVRREKKGRSGKTVTRISGLPKTDLDALAKEMKKALGCGASVESPDLLLLGDLVDRAAAWLEKAGAARIVKGN